MQKQTPCMESSFSVLHRSTATQPQERDQRKPHVSLGLCKNDVWNCNYSMKSYITALTLRACISLGVVNFKSRPLTCVWAGT